MRWYGLWQVQSECDRHCSSRQAGTILRTNTLLARLHCSSRCSSSSTTVGQAAFLEIWARLTLIPVNYRCTPKLQVYTQAHNFLPALMLCVQGCTAYGHLLQHAKLPYQYGIALYGCHSILSCLIAVQYLTCNLAICSDLAAWIA